MGILQSMNYILHLIIKYANSLNSNTKRDNQNDNVIQIKYKQNKTKIPLTASVIA